MQDFEKQGAFYLGKNFDLETNKTADDLLLYKSKDLTTHAVCVGMTGSGKTGLCLALLEEAALDGIPAIAIDPKGDIGNLLLAFPNLLPSDFQPWVDPAEATRKGLTVEQLAEQTAKLWKEGLASWGEDGARIARYKESVEISIYTPGSTAGLPLTVLKSFDPPAAAVRQNAEALRERIAASVSGLLALLGINADPLRSREHILLANLLDYAWQAERSLDMSSLIHEIQNPPFEKVGVMDLESFFPAKDRFALAMSLNNLLASPGFNVWMQGESLEIDRLLHTPSGKPRLTIISIAHLTDAERMFFVTILLSELIAWMRSQSGTSSLRALLYMDEVFGYFPPSANPPSKTPMLTLLKQARAYGLGVVLATQNPVDLDYKGLSNAGTWLLGRLQTERDKARVLDGLEGASAAAGAKFDRQTMERILSGLGNRVFLMNNVHEDAPQVFQSRWALSYLRGPLTREQISTLMADQKAALQTANGKAENGTSVPGSSGGSNSQGNGANDIRSNSQRPVLPPGVPEAFVSRSKLLPTGAVVKYQPALLGTARVHFVENRSEVDVWQNNEFLVRGDTLADLAWDSASTMAANAFEFDPQPEATATYDPLPAKLALIKTFSVLRSGLKDFVYQSQRLKLWNCELLAVRSLPDETQDEFKTRLTELANTTLAATLEHHKQKFQKTLAALQEQERKAIQRVEKQKSQRWQKFKAAMWRGLMLLSSIILRALEIFGNSKTRLRKIATASDMGKIATTGKVLGTAMNENTDIGHATENLETIQAKIVAAQQAAAEEETRLKQQYDPRTLTLTELSVSPRKADIDVNTVTILWLPYFVDSTNKAEPAFEQPPQSA